MTPSLSFGSVLILTENLCISRLLSGLGRNLKSQFLRMEQLTPLGIIVPIFNVFALRHLVLTLVVRLIGELWRPCGSRQASSRRGLARRKLLRRQVRTSSIPNATLIRIAIFSSLSQPFLSAASA